MADAYLILVRCMADDLPCMLFDDKDEAMAVAAAMTPAKVWGIARMADFPTDCEPLTVDVVTFRDGIAADSTTVQECTNDKWSRECPPDVPPIIQWIAEQGLGRVEHAGGNSWVVRSDERPATN